MKVTIEISNEELKEIAHIAAIHAGLLKIGCAADGIEDRILVRVLESAKNQGEKL